MLNKKLTPLRAIKIHCKECCIEDGAKNCTVETCELFQFRLGKNQRKVKVALSDAEKAELISRLHSRETSC